MRILAEQIATTAADRETMGVPQGFRERTGRWLTSLVGESHAEGAKHCQIKQRRVALEAVDRFLLRLVVRGHRRRREMSDLAWRRRLIDQANRSKRPEITVRIDIRAGEHIDAQLHLVLGHRQRLDGHVVRKGGVRRLFDEFRERLNVCCPHDLVLDQEEPSSKCGSTE